MQYVYLDETSLQSCIWDEVSHTVISENFSYVVDTLMKFDPGYAYKGRGIKAPDGTISPRGGMRRIHRVATIEANKFAANYNINYLGESEETVVGIKVPVDKWRFVHNVYTDTELKEKHKVLEPITVAITSRKSLQDGSATRCYVSCQCHDFNYTFRYELAQLGYLEDHDIEAPTVKATTPGICKHILTILYRDPVYRHQLLVVEKGVASVSASIAPASKTTAEVPSLSSQQPEIPTTEPDTVQQSDVTEPVDKYQQALEQIKTALATVSSQINPNVIDNYLNNTFGSKRDIKGKYFKYRFTVKRPRNGLIGSVKIYVTSTGMELPVPDKSIWDLFNLHKNPRANRIHDRRVEELRNLVRETGEMPEELQKSLGSGVYLENSLYIDETLLAEDVSVSSILSSVTK